MASGFFATATPGYGRFQRGSRKGWHVLLSRPEFPSYSEAERVADCVIHLLGLVGASIATIWLVSRFGPGATSSQIAAMSIYCVGLIGMLSASAMYNLARPGRLKAVLRRLDHSMIFVMIAGSYTPFVMTSLRPGLGIPVCAAVWGLAASGVCLKLTGAIRCERLSLALYLGMGWLVLGVLRPLLSVLPDGVLVPLLIGGVIYSLGSLVHVRARMPFHNAMWHGMVVIAAGFHLVAVAELPPGLAQGQPNPL
jgi:hemolysin III